MQAVHHTLETPVLPPASDKGLAVMQRFLPPTLVEADKPRARHDRVDDWRVTNLSVAQGRLADVMGRAEVANRPCA